MICKNCEQNFNGNYCSNCEQNSNARKIDYNDLISDILTYLIFILVMIIGMKIGTTFMKIIE
jgi:hypothetical protein